MQTKRTATLKNLFWERNIQFRGSRGAFWIGLLAVAALASELGVHNTIFDLRDTLHATTLVPFANVGELLLADLDQSVAAWLVIGVVVRVMFGAVVATLDLVFYQDITGRRFDWEGMINLAAVNVIFLCTAAFTFMNPALRGMLTSYESIVNGLPTLIDLHGGVAAVVACLLGDLCYYWSHRLCHKVRLFWKLGHINHHRARDMSQLTHSVDPHALLLDAAGGKVFVLLLLPIATKLFTLDLHEAGWTLVVILLIDAWLNPSHSIVLYYAESRLRVLRWFRYVLVTPAVHYVHHSCEPQHNISDGSNFAARFSLWDRLFGTYVEPPRQVPHTGLYGDHVDYCKNPLRFVFLPYVELLAELRANQLKYWLAILFGSTAWQPPCKPAGAKRRVAATPLIPTPQAPEPVPAFVALAALPHSTRPEHVGRQRARAVTHLEA